MEILSESPTQQITKLQWPPFYTLRISKKAKHVHLKISVSRGGLEIIVPFIKKNKINIENLLEQKRTWIEKHWHLIANRQSSLQIIHVLPKACFLQAINEQWHFIYHNNTNKKYIITKINSQLNQIIIMGPILDDNYIKIKQIIIKWLQLKARQHLVPWIEQLSIKYQLYFNKINIRKQKTLWGSCNSYKNINLNYKLLFLPENLVQHVLLHELCHTKHLNHSVKFWNLLKKLDINCNLNNRTLHMADQYMPEWL